MRKFLKMLMVLCCITAFIRTGQPFGVFRDIHKNKAVNPNEVKTSQLQDPQKTDDPNQTPQTENTLFDGTIQNRLVAHRGLSSKYPDNSRIAFESAGRDESFWGIETDIFETADGEFICIHDEELEEGTSGSGSVKDKSYYDEIKPSSDIISDKNTDGIDESDLKIPKLSSFLDVCDYYDKVPIIEIKEIQNYDKLLNKEIEDFKNKCVITGADIDALKEVRKRDINIPLMIIGYEQRPYTDYTSLIKELPNNIPLTNTGILYHFHMVNQDVVNEVHSMGYLIGVWTVDSEEELEIYKSYGVDFIVTNGVQY